jgi:hypothetical protein
MISFYIEKTLSLKKNYIELIDISFAEKDNPGIEGKDKTHSCSNGFWMALDSISQIYTEDKKLRNKLKRVKEIVGLNYKILDKKELTLCNIFWQVIICLQSWTKKKFNRVLYKTTHSCFSFE